MQHLPDRCFPRKRGAVPVLGNAWARRHPGTTAKEAVLNCEIRSTPRCRPVRFRPRHLPAAPHRLAASSAFALLSTTSGLRPCQAGGSLGRSGTMTPATQPRHADGRHRRHPAARRLDRQPRHPPRRRARSSASTRATSGSPARSSSAAAGASSGCRTTTRSSSSTTRRSPSPPGIAPAPSAGARATTPIARPGPRASASTTPSARQMNRQLHGERIVRGTHRRRLHELPWADLPDGAFVLLDGSPCRRRRRAPDAVDARGLRRSPIPAHSGKRQRRSRRPRPWPRCAPAIPVQIAI